MTLAEIGVIGCIAILMVDPKDWPKIASEIGHLCNQLKRTFKKFIS
jgi:Sec-independent protein translocase protein TatA